VTTKNNMTTSGSYIFAPDGIILAYPETHDGSTSRRNSDNNIYPFRRFSFVPLVKKLFQLYKFLVEQRLFKYLVFLSVSNHTFQLLTCIIFLLANLYRVFVQQNCRFIIDRYFHQTYEGSSL